MSSRRGVLLLASVILGVWLAPLLALAEGGPICAALQRGSVAVDEADPRGDVYLGTGAQWLTDDLRKRYPPLPRPPQNAAALRFQVQRVQIVLQGSRVFESPLAQSLRARLLEELAIIDAALAKLDASKPVALDQLNGLYDVARLDQTTQFSEACDGVQYTTNSLFFQDASSNEQVVLRAAAQASAGVEGLALPVAGQRISFVSIAEASEFRAALEAVRSLLSEPLLRSVVRASARLSRINLSWSNYLEHGFSQYPWEALINSLGTLRWDQAPWSQWIFVHPELAVVADARKLRGAAVSSALLVHGLGFAVYGATRSWFVGVSATGAVTTNQRLGLGGGGTLHFGHTQLYTRLPHISLSVLFFATDTGKPGPFVGVSLDLWRLVSDSGESIFKNSFAQ